MFSSEFQHKWFTESEVPFVGKRNISFGIIEIRGERFVHILTVHVKLTRLFTEESGMFRELPETHEIDPVHDILESCLHARIVWPLTVELRSEEHTSELQSR